MIELQEIANLPLFRPTLAVLLTVLALASQFIPAARFPMHASIFFAILATLGWRQGWPASLTGQTGSGASPVLGLAWLAEASLAAFFLVIALILTLGRGRGALVALLLSIPIFLAGTGAKLGWWPDALAWPDAPWAPLALPGSLPLGGALLLFLAATACFVLQNDGSSGLPAPVPEPGNSDPARRIILGAGLHPDEDPERAEDYPGEEPCPAPNHPWSPLRKRAIRRHRHRRAARGGR